MPAPQYSISTEGAGGTDVSLTGTTKRTVLGVKAHANSGLLLLGFSISMVDTNAAEVPVLVEVSYSTWATQGTMGTNNTTATPTQINGRSMAAGFTAGHSWTTQPTVITSLVFPTFTLTPNGGTFIYNWPLGTEPDCALAEGFAISCTAPANTACRAGMIVSRA
jgi:hypothetical protein